MLTFNTLYHEARAICKKLQSNATNRIVEIDVIFEGLEERNDNAKLYDCCWKIFSAEKNGKPLDELVLFLYECIVHTRQNKLLKPLGTELIALLQWHYKLHQTEKKRGSWPSIFHSFFENTFAEINSIIESMDKNQIYKYRYACEIKGFEEQYVDYQERIKNYKLINNI